MDSILLVSSAEKVFPVFTEMLVPAHCSQIVPAASGAAARRLLAESDYDVVIVNCPLPDEFGHELGCLAADRSGAGVILLVKSDIADEVSAKVENAGVFVVPRPVSKPFFFQAFKLVAAARARILGLKSENLRLQSKIEEIRLVDRAKCTLIQYLNMTEQQAHRYIEKQAMDMRLTRREIAQNVLKTYEM